MTKTYDDILTTDDLTNINAFLDSWSTVVGMIDAVSLLVSPHVRDTMTPIMERLEANKIECKVLQRKLAVAIHYSQGGTRP